MNYPEGLVLLNDDFIGASQGTIFVSGYEKVSLMAMNF
jgi:hypothetical protein